MDRRVSNKRLDAGTFYPETRGFMIRTQDEAQAIIKSISSKNILDTDDADTEDAAANTSEYVHDPVIESA